MLSVLVHNPPVTKPPSGACYFRDLKPGELFRVTFLGASSEVRMRIEDGSVVVGRSGGTLGLVRPRSSHILNDADYVRVRRTGADTYEDVVPTPKLYTFAEIPAGSCFKHRAHEQVMLKLNPDCNRVYFAFGSPPIEATVVDVSTGRPLQCGSVTGGYKREYQLLEGTLSLVVQS